MMPGQPSDLYGCPKFKFRAHIFSFSEKMTMYSLSRVALDKERVWVSIQLSSFQLSNENIYSSCEECVVVDNVVALQFA